MTIAPYRSGTRAGRDGFAPLLHAEWTKFGTVRGWVVGMAAAALAMVAVGLLGTAAPGATGHGAHPPIPKGPGGEAVNDSFYFVHQSLDGDGSITVSVTSLTGVNDEPQHMSSGVQPWAKAGLIVKESLRQGSAYAAIMVTGGHGVRMQYDYTHDTAGLPGSVSVTSPRWLRLTRSGDMITGYDSVDGTRWTEVGTARLAGLSSTVQAGLFATSPAAVRTTGAGRASSSPAMATAVFGHVGLRGQWPGGAWRGEKVGQDAGTSGSYSDELKGGFTESGGRLTVSGAGDIAPVVGGVSMGPGFTIENFLVGAFAGMIMLIVVGTAFITAEYRRGLIRTTLAASPRRGRVLVAKAIVLGSVAFTVGLVAAAVTIPLGERRAKAIGFLVFPVTSLTELRVVVGTALVLAVAAVLALAVGAMLRRSAAAVAIVVAAIVVPYILALSSVLPTGPSEWLLRITPAAGFAIQQSVPRYPQVISSYTPSSGYYPLAPWAGFAVLCGYATLALAMAVVLLRRRDV
jgi:ABC-type transport system involved in multi-copper enzyme maturation permease subunit